MAVPARHKIPESALVVIYTPALEVLLIERADRPGYWQSVTGSRQEGESLPQTAVREVAEETGLDAATHELTDWSVSNVYEIFPIWRHRYAPGVTHNTEHVFGLRLPGPREVRLAPHEHLRWRWVPWRQAAEEVFSWSNRQAILMLPGKEADRAGTPS
jgi:dihydroneopterin triphosphate diphosphatase